MRLKKPRGRFEGPRGHLLRTFSTPWKTRWSRSWRRRHDARQKSPSLIACQVRGWFHVAGRGLVLTEDVKPGDVLLEVPNTILLHPGALAKRGPLPCAPRKAYETGKRPRALLSSHQIIACSLAQWRAAGRPACPMSPFLDSLPKDFPTAPLTWLMEGGTDQKQLLNSLSLTARARADKVRAQFERDWNRLMDAQKTTPDTLQNIWACIASQTPLARISRSDFLWGWLCTNSRCVYMDLKYSNHEDNFTLAPLLDMANHTAVPWLECKVRYDPRGGLELLAPSQPRPSDAGRTGWCKGDEVCITYGAHANTTLLAEYGFVLPRAIHSDNKAWTGNRYCDVLLDEQVNELFRQQGELGDWKRELLENEGYWG